MFRAAVADGLYRNRIRREAKAGRTTYDGNLFVSSSATSPSRHHVAGGGRETGEPTQPYSNRG